MSNLYNDTTDALFNAIDIKKTIESNNLNNLKGVHVGTDNEDTLEDLITDVVYFLENLTEQLKEDNEYSKLICVPAPIYIEHTCLFADQIMQDRLNRSYEDYLLGNDDIGYSYTDEGQDIFNDILDEVESFLAKFNVVNGSRYDPEESLT